jgi:hypothetical protein
MREQEIVERALENLEKETQIRYADEAMPIIHLRS